MTSWLEIGLVAVAKDYERKGALKGTEVAVGHILVYMPQPFASSEEPHTVHGVRVNWVLDERDTHVARDRVSRNSLEWRFCCRC